MVNITQSNVRCPQTYAAIVGFVQILYNKIQNIIIYWSWNFFKAKCLRNKFKEKYMQALKEDYRKGCF